MYELYKNSKTVTTHEDFGGRIFTYYNTDQVKKKITLTLLLMDQKHRSWRAFFTWF